MAENQFNILEVVNNILILTSWSYKDALIQTYTMPYILIINKYLPENSHIYLQTLEQTHLETTLNEQEVIIEELKRNRIEWVRVKYFRFGLFAGIKWFLNIIRLLILCKSKKITHIHAWCTPAGMIGYILSLLTGIPLILDSYEPHATAMVDSNTWKKGSLAYRILFYFEKKQSKHASTVIAVTEGMRGYAKENYNVSFNEFYSKPACVDMNLFSRESVNYMKTRKELAIEEEIVCVYAGKFGGIYLDHEVFDFFKVAYDYWQGHFKVLLLTGHAQKKIDTYVKRSSLEESAVIRRFVPHSIIPGYLGIADFAITPIKPTPSKKFSAPIKDGEYWAMGLPVVITPNISDDSDIISKNKIGAVLEDFSEASYLNAIRTIDNLLQNNVNDTLHQKIRGIAKKFRSFAIAEEIYREIYS